MKPALFLICFLVIFAITPSFAQLSDKTGLVNKISVQADGEDFQVEVVGSFDVTDYGFNNEERKLTLHFSSFVQNNLAEIQIPKNLTNGNFTMHLNDERIFPDIKTNERIYFVTLEFPGEGFHKLDIIGTPNPPEIFEDASLVVAILAIAAAAALIGVVIKTRKKTTR